MGNIPRESTLVVEAADAPPRKLASARVSVVIPAFNEAASIGTTLEPIARFLRASAGSFEIVVVDDGSADATAATAAALPAEMGVVVVQLSRNFGQGAAISAGLDVASGDVVVCMDADGQHPLPAAREMLQHWESGYDMVYAYKRHRDDESRFKRFGSRWFYRLIGIGTSVHIPPNASEFRVMDRKVVDALKRMTERTRFMKGLFAWVGFRSLGIPYDPLPRTKGTSTYSRRKLIAFAWTGLTAYTAAPLRAASAVGLLLSLGALAYGVWVVIDKLVYNEDVPGWPTITASIMFFSGVQLLFIGVLGEYLARVFDEVKSRPNYIIARIMRHGPG
ncbi:MAG TPA: glycosyltransferase family 2 protein [Burkholderiaceae bacterium]|nr:glycosyltransferase family 2 protein [Burkholderiaceae bacterium]